MPASGPFVKISGLQRQARRLYVKLSGLFFLGSRVYVKIGGVWRRTALLLRSSLVIGTSTTASGTSYGYYIGGPNYGAMSEPTLGWNSVLRSLYASKTTDNRTRVVIEVSSVANAMPYNSSTAVITFVSSTGDVISFPVTSIQDLVPRTFWQLGDGAQSLAVYNWLAARNGLTITVQGAFA